MKEDMKATRWIKKNAPVSRCATGMMATKTKLTESPPHLQWRRRQHLLQHRHQHLLQRQHRNQRLHLRRRLPTLLRRRQPTPLRRRQPTLLRQHRHLQPVRANARHRGSLMVQPSNSAHLHRTTQATRGATPKQRAKVAPRAVPTPAKTGPSATWRTTPLSQMHLHRRLQRRSRLQQRSRQRRSHLLLRQRRSLRLLPQPQRNQPLL